MHIGGIIHLHDLKPENSLTGPTLRSLENPGRTLTDKGTDLDEIIRIRYRC